MILDDSGGNGNKTAVIICTGCGKKNGDDSRHCAKCGKKLQSARQNVASMPDSPKRLTRFDHKGIPEDRWIILKRMMEAWAYLGLLVAVAAGCAVYDVWWPIYPAVGVLTLLLYFRKI